MEEIKQRQVRFSNLVKLFAKDVFRYAFWLCGDREIAADLAQETFTRAWKAFFAQEMKQFETVLLTAMQVTVPADLTKRILVQSANQRMITSSWHRFHWQLAASLLLFVSLSLSGLWWWSTSHHKPLEQQLMVYLAQEPKVFSTAQQVPLAELHKMFNAIGAKLVGKIGTVSFCKVLKLNGYTSAHMVLVENNQPINILLIRDSPIRQVATISSSLLNRHFIV